MSGMPWAEVGGDRARASPSAKGGAAKTVGGGARVPGTWKPMPVGWSGVVVGVVGIWGMGAAWRGYRILPRPFPNPTSCPTEIWKDKEILPGVIVPIPPLQENWLLSSRQRERERPASLAGEMTFKQRRPTRQAQRGGQLPLRPPRRGQGGTATYYGRPNLREGRGFGLGLHHPHYIEVQNLTLD